MNIRFRMIISFSEVAIRDTYDFTGVNDLEGEAGKVNMEILIVILFGVVGLLLVWYLFLWKSLNMIVTSHIIMFIAFFYFYQIISMLVIRTKYDIDIFILSNLVVFLYILSLSLLASHFHRHIIRNQQLMNFMMGVDERFILLFIAVWILCKGFLITRYGEAAFQALARREEVGMGYLIASIDSLLMYPAFGSFVIYFCTRILGKRHHKRFFELLLLVTALIFFIFSVVFSLDLGVRRVITFLLIIYVLTMIHRMQYRNILKATVYVVGLIPLLFVFYMYYQSIRWNVYDPNINSMLLYGNVRQVIKGIGLSLIPQNQFKSGLVMNVEERKGPFSVLHQVIMKQVDKGETTKGKFIAQSVNNVVPAFVSKEKITINADEILSSVYDLPPIDLPTSILAILQSECFFFGFIITSLLFLGLFLLYSKLLLFLPTSVLFRATVIGLLFKTAYFAESSLDVIFVDIRNLIFICAVSFILFQIRDSISASVKKPYTS